MQDLDRSATRPVPSPTTLPRLMPGDHLDDYRTHIECFGPRPRGDPVLIAEIERAGLRGHGGAGFPTATKLAAVARRRRGGYVVANATEGEPMSTKDKTLCATAPHLVLDGAAIAAETVRAAAVVVCVDRSAPRLAQILTRAVAARASHGADTVPVRVTAAPDRYVAGEESALVRWLNGFDAKPTFVPPRPFEKGVGNRPTLVQNVETLAHIALIARYGAALVPRHRYERRSRVGARHRVRRGRGTRPSSRSHSGWRCRISSQPPAGHSTLRKRCSSAATSERGYEPNDARGFISTPYRCAPPARRSAAA